MIACRPDPQALARTQDTPRTIGVVALAADRDGLRPWVDAYHPEHLGGELVTPAPPALQVGLLERILAPYTTRFTTRVGPLATGDQLLLGEALHQLRRHRHPHTPGTLMAVALRAGWPGLAAWALHRLSAGWDGSEAPGQGADLPGTAQQTRTACPER